MKLKLTPLIPITDEIKFLMVDARILTERDINKRLVQTYWHIGRIIAEHEQDGDIRAQYGKRLLSELAYELTRKVGRECSKSNLFNMRRFYVYYPNFPDVSGELTWSHYCELLSVSDPDARSFYEEKAMNSNWSVRELKQQINTSLFERLFPSDVKTNKETVLALSRIKKLCWNLGAALCSWAANEE